VIKSRKIRGRDMWHAWGRGEVFTGFWLGSPKVKRPLGRPGRRWEDNIKMDVREVGIDGANCDRLLRVASSGELQTE
jgi:hypothetical protein